MPRESPVPPVDVPKFIPVVLVPKPVPKAGVAPKPVVPLKLGVPKAPVPKRPGLAAVEAVAPGNREELCCPKPPNVGPAALVGAPNVRPVVAGLAPKAGVAPGALENKPVPPPKIETNVKITIFQNTQGYIVLTKPTKGRRSRGSRGSPKIECRSGPETCGRLRCKETATSCRCDCCLGETETRASSCRTEGWLGCTENTTSGLLKLYKRKLDNVSRFTTQFVSYRLLLTETEGSGLSRSSESSRRLAGSRSSENRRSCTKGRFHSLSLWLSENAGRLRRLSGTESER